MFRHRDFLRGFPTRPQIVGLTGGIACGKSLARRMFQELNVPCIDADEVARVIHQNPLHPAMKKIAQAFPDIVANSGTLKRGTLRNLLAIDPIANRRLKTILRPYVMNAIHRWTKDQRTPYVIWESALILEENISVNRVLVVDAEEERRVARIRNRNPEWNEAHIQNVLAIQLSRDAYLKHAHDILNNDLSDVELKQEVEVMHSKYITLWG